MGVLITVWDIQPSVNRLVNTSICHMDDRCLGKSIDAAG